MKLISKTNRNFSLAILIVLPISCLLLYFFLNYFIAEEVDEKLKVDQWRISEQLKINPDLVSMAPIFEVQEIGEALKIDTEIKDVHVYDPIEKEEELFRELVAKKKINGKWYLITVRHSTIEQEDFLLAIGGTMTIILVLVLLFLHYLNSRLSQKLWQPFYKNLQALKSFNFNEGAQIQLDDSNLHEFQELKQSLILLTDKLQSDYNALKEFTENASHEIQTPLSILSLLLEEILQDEHAEMTYKKLYVCYQSVQRLSKLNDRLLVLTKLDNNQYNQKVDVDFNILLTDKLQEFEALFRERDMQIVVEENDTFVHQMDTVLANMLLVNLLSNAFKHAVYGTPFHIEINSNSLRFTNTTEASIDETQLFERFKKGINAVSSTGLGLAIVKRIVTVSDLHIQASVLDKQFSICIKKG